MNLNEYQTRAMSTRTESCNNISYMGFGLSAEVGELHDKIAKSVRKENASIDDNRLYLTDDIEVASDIMDGIKKELGDVLWFVAGVADVLGWSLEDVAQANIDKLADRQKRGVIIGNGDNR